MSSTVSVPSTVSPASPWNHPMIRFALNYAPLRCSNPGNSTSSHTFQLNISKYTNYLQSLLAAAKGNYKSDSVMIIEFLLTILGSIFFANRERKKVILVGIMTNGHLWKSISIFFHILFSSFSGHPH